MTDIIAVRSRLLARHQRRCSAVAVSTAAGQACAMPPEFVRGCSCCASEGRGGKLPGTGRRMIFTALVGKDLTGADWTSCADP